jgi:GNAT superfamily N-acetyltransferase
LAEHIEIAGTDKQIAETFEVMHQLRPNLTLDGYVKRIRGLMRTDRFKLAYLAEGALVRAVAGFRLMEMLYCGRILSVDDLVVDELVRSHGHGARMLDWLAERGRLEGCNEMQLISRVVREQAHRFYFRHGMGIDCFHFRVEL